MDSEDRGTREGAASITLGWGILAVLEDAGCARAQASAIVAVASLFVL